MMTTLDLFDNQPADGMANSDMKKSAVLSPCGFYRYQLMRVWDEARPLMCLMMLNPSVADHKIDDPTARRGIGFAKGFGFGGLVIANAYAFRATDPADLWTHADPVGQENDDWIIRSALPSSEVVCAWGTNAKPERVAAVVALLTGLGVRLKCLGTTKSGAPRHPLYVRGDQPLLDWSPP